MRLYSKLSDAELVDLLKLGNNLAYTEIYDRYWALLFRHARKILRDDEEAGDVVQDVFTILWGRLETLNFTTSLSAYLYTSVRNKTLNIIKGGKIREKFLEVMTKVAEEDPSCFVEDLIVKDLAARIEAGVAKLPPKMRSVFEMSRSKGFSHHEIAKELDISNTTVKKQINRAIKLLRLRIDLVILSILLFFC